MAGHRPLQSPVLVGRDDLLALADRRLAAAAAGQGHLLFVAGEAGIGKTRLLAAIADAARRRSFGVVRAAAFPGDVEASGGLLLDLASDLRQSGEAGLREVGEAMAGRLRELAGVGGDRHRQRRLLVQDLTDLAGRIGSGGPVLAVLEDLHWADQLSLEVVGHLAVRLAGRSLLVAGAYRSNGIPLHVEELLAAVEDPATQPGPGGIPAVPVPDTLADAVLARARALLTEVSRLDPEAVDHGLRRLQERYLVVPGADPHRSFDFRHASSATCSTATSRCRSGAACTSGWPPWPPGAATATPSSRPTSSRPGWPSPPTATRWRRPARRPPCRPTGRRWPCTGGPSATCPPARPRPSRPTGCWPPPLRCGRPCSAPRPPPTCSTMLDRRLDEAIGYGEESLAVAGGDDAATLNTAATLGSVLVFAGRMDEGWAMLEAAVGRAIERRLEAEAARGYRMLGSCASVLVEYDRAERWLPAGIDYAGRVELWNHRHYMAAHLAHVRWAVGRWEEADRTAEHALADGRGGITTRITAEHVLGYLAMGRGDWARAGELLGDALRRGEAIAELQRLSPALWGLAETALLRGDHETAIALCDRGHQASDRVGDAAYLFPFLVTGVRARLAGPGADEAERWLAEVARALAVQATAQAIVAEADRLLDTAAGGRPVALWSPLTAREFEVARLVAAGNTNRQIAAELFPSPKTVGSHVEHILTKLGVARRAEIAAWVAALPPASTSAGG